MRIARSMAPEPRNSLVKRVTDVRNNSTHSWYELGAVLLVPASVYLSFSAGRVLGFEGAELVGYSLGSPVTAVIIVSLCQFSKAARTRSAISKIAFFTMLLFLFGTAGTLFQERARQVEISSEIDPKSLAVDEEPAVALAQQIVESVKDGQVSNIQILCDPNRFANRALRGRDKNARSLQELARSAGRAFAKNPILDQLAAMVKLDGFFSFVKFYHREGEPILQFRLTDGSGGLHYVDFYVFKTIDETLRIEDIHYYNSGDPLSKQLIETLTNADDSNPGGESENLETLKRAVELNQQGNVQEAATLIEALPDAAKQQKTVMRWRVQFAYMDGAQNADQLFREFTERYPGDSSIVFSAFLRASSRDDLTAAANLLDDIYRTVNGDDFLLWHKVGLLVEAKDYPKAIQTLDKMEKSYSIDVLSHAEHQLREEFLSSKEYRAWLRTHERLKETAYERQR
jgi:hypothetical protein